MAKTKKSSVGAPALVWRRDAIHETKRRVKEEIDSAVPPADPKGMSFLLDAIREGIHDSSGAGQLRCFLLVVSALMRHARIGGLKRRDIERLQELGAAILRTQGIEPVDSRLSFLHGELHLGLSLAYLKDGSQWEAIWEHGLAIHLSRREPAGAPGFLAHAAGIRSLRLGHAKLASRELERAVATLDDSRARRHALLERLKALRLGGDCHRAEEEGRKLLSDPESTLGERQEALWEEKCRRAQSNGDVAELMASVRRGGSHHDAYYLLEAFLWSRAVKTRKWLAQYPTIRSIAPNAKLDLKGQGFRYHCAKVVESCYDFGIPYELRLRAVGEALGDLGRLFTIEDELLVLAAAARWLARSQTELLAEVTAARYRALSLALTDGASDDALGVFAEPELLGQTRRARSG